MRKILWQLNKKFFGYWKKVQRTCCQKNNCKNPPWMNVRFFAPVSAIWTFFIFILHARERALRKRPLKKRTKKHSQSTRRLRFVCSRIRHGKHQQCDTSIFCESQIEARMNFRFAERKKMKMLRNVVAHISAIEVTLPF